jgi:hypothetical protein
MKMAFRVGQKVTLKEDGEWPDRLAGEIYPDFGVVYTVRAIEPDDEGGALLLNEIRNEPRDYEEAFGEATFDCDEFRPVVERKTDISIFEKMLTGGKQPAQVL